MSDYYADIGALPRGHGLFYTYLFGFLLSILATVTAYFVVASHFFETGMLIAAVAVLALLQCAVQVVCFLHIGLEKRSRLKLLVLGFGLLVVTILVSGSLWIMIDLDQRMMPDQAHMMEHMRHEGGF